MPTRGKKDPNGRALRGRRAHTTFISDPIAQIWSNYNVRSGAAGAATPEQPAVQNCLYDRFEALYKKSSIKPSLVIVPARFKSGTLYSEIPTTGAPLTSSVGDFTVTRATTATRVNASGLIESVASGIPRLDYFASGGTVGCPALLVEPSASNGILNSTDTATSWTLGANLTSGAIDVIGVSGNNISIAVSGSGIGSAAGRFVRFSNNVALASGSTYTISFLIKKTASHTIGGYQLTMSSGVIGSGFDVSGSFASGSNVDTAPTTNRTRRIERWGTDVFRCIETFTMTAAATGTHLAFGPVVAVTVSTNSAVGTQLGFAAPQLELGSVPTSFIPTTTAAITRNADVLTTPTVTNLALQSENFLNFPPWSANGITVSGNVTGTTDPSGGNTADQIFETAVPGNHFIAQTMAITNGTTYAGSVFLKKASGSPDWMQVAYSTTGLAGFANFNLTSGTVGTAGAGCTGRIENYGNGWYRCTLIQTSNASGTSGGPVIVFTNNTDPSARYVSYTGNAATSIYAWGAQLETGSVTNYYVPTTTTSVTSSASGSIGQTEGTIYAEVDVRNWVNLSRIFSISDGTTTNRIMTLFNTSNRFRVIVDSGGGAAQVDISSASLTNGIHKIAVGYAANDVVFYVNGALVSGDTTVNIPACNQVFLGKIETSASTNFLNDRIRAVALYTTRLTNTQLALITQL